MGQTAMAEISTEEQARQIQQELEGIASRNGNELRAEDVVEYARTHTSSALHSKFTWNVKEASYEYWLWQARQIIRLTIRVQPRITPDAPTRVYVSLVNDREKPGGGYRRLLDVLADPAMRRDLMAQALRELEVWRAKYREVKELSAIFDAMDQIKAKRA